jgi:hypothetical protein
MAEKKCLRCKEAMDPIAIPAFDVKTKVVHWCSKCGTVDVEGDDTVYETKLAEFADAVGAELGDKFLADTKVKEDRMLAILNRLAEMTQGKDMYRNISSGYVLILSVKEGEAIEKEFPELGIKRIRAQWGGEWKDLYAVTVPSLLATITDIFCGKRLAFQQQPVKRGQNPRQGDTTGLTWWKPGEEHPDGDGAKTTCDWQECEVNAETECSGCGIPLCEEHAGSCGYCPQCD